MFQLPLYKNDNQCSINTQYTSLDNIERLKGAIQEGELSLVENQCLCCNPNREKDLVITEKDRYGFAVPQLLCSKCGLIRSKWVFNEESNNLFYSKYYRGIYAQDIKTPYESLFKDQYNRGKNILALIEGILQLNEIHDIAEIGSGMGGIILPFYEKGCQVRGFDYDEDYLEYGRRKGLSLICGDFYDYVSDESCDLLIMSHVFEHFLHPLYELRRLIRKVRINKFLYIEVPGIFNIDKVYKSPILYFQNAHVYNYYKDYLWFLFEDFGLHVLYGDESCRFIVRRVKRDIPEVDFIYSDKLSKYPQLIANYLITTKEKYEWNSRIEKIKKSIKSTRLLRFLIHLVTSKTSKRNIK